MTSDTPHGFVPGMWAEAIQSQIFGDRSAIARMFGPTRTGHWEPLSEAMKRQYTDWEQRWNAVVAEGEAKGFLSWGYEGPEVEEPAGTFVYDESVEDFARRRAEWEAGISKGPVTFPVRGSDVTND